MRSLRAVLSRVAGITVLAVVGGQAHALCTFGNTGEPSLQTSFDALLGPAALNAQSACVAEGRDAAWTTVGSIGQIDIVLELAGNAQSNVFGVYDLNDPTRRLSVFEGNDSVNSEATLRLRLMGNGTWRISVLETNNPDDTSDWTHLGLTTSSFGFYLATASQGTFYSQTSRNADGVDHLYAYRGNGAAFQQRTVERRSVHAAGLHPRLGRFVRRRRSRLPGLRRNRAGHPSRAIAAGAAVDAFGSDRPRGGGSPPNLDPARMNALSRFEKSIGPGIGRAEAACGAPQRVLAPRV